MNWFFLAIISVISISIANIYQRIVMKEPESDAYGSSVIFQLLLAAITGCYALYKGFVFPPIVEYWQFFIISAVFYAGGTLALFHAIKRIGASEVIIVSALGAVVTIILAMILLHEPFTVQQAIGTLAILVSVIIVQGKISLKNRAGIAFAALGTSLYSVAVISDMFIIRHYDAVSYVSVISLLPGLVLIMFQPSVLLRLKKICTPIYTKNIILYSGFYGIQAITYYLALENGANVSQMSPIARSQVILTVILAVIFLKEKNNLPRKILSSVLVTIGVMLIK